MNVVKNFDTVLNQFLQKASSQQLLKGTIQFLLILYIARIAPDVPQGVADLFKNNYFRLVVFSLVLWTAQFSPSISILLSVAFIITMNYAVSKPLWEFLENVSESEKKEEKVEEQPKEQVQAETKSQEVEVPEAQTSMSELGCYPSRRFDMAVVEPIEEGASLSVL